MFKIAGISIVCCTILVSFSGCATAIKCQAPDNSTVRISVLEDSDAPVLIRDRWNPLMQAVYDDIITVDETKIIANRNFNDRIHPNSIFQNQKLLLDAKNNKIDIGEGSYTCNPNELQNIIHLVTKIKNEEIEKRKRKLEIPKI